MTQFPPFGPLQPVSEIVSTAPRYRFKPIYRLCKTDEYSSVFAFRRSVRGRYFVLHYLPVNPPRPQGPRFGVVVAKKLAKSSVLRNLIKRLAREQFRLMRDTLPAYDLIMRLNAPARDAARRALRDDIVWLLKRLPR